MPGSLASSWSGPSQGSGFGNSFCGVNEAASCVSVCAGEDLLPGGVCLHWPPSSEAVEAGSPSAPEPLAWGRSPSFLLLAASAAFPLGFLAFCTGGRLPAKNLDLAQELGLG